MTPDGGVGGVSLCCVGAGGGESWGSSRGWVDGRGAGGRGGVEVEQPLAASHTAWAPAHAYRTPGPLREEGIYGGAYPLVCRGAAKPPKHLWRGTCTDCVCMCRPPPHTRVMYTYPHPPFLLALHPTAVRGRRCCCRRCSPPSKAGPTTTKLGRWRWRSSMRRRRSLRSTRSRCASTRAHALVCVRVVWGTQCQTQAWCAWWGPGSAARCAGRRTQSPREGGEHDGGAELLGPPSPPPFPAPPGPDYFKLALSLC